MNLEEEDANSRRSSLLQSMQPEYAIVTKTNENLGTSEIESENSILKQQKHPVMKKLPSKNKLKEKKKARFSQEKPVSFKEKGLISDNNNEEYKKKMTKYSKKRFGRAIKFEQYRTSNFVKILCIALAIIMIPMEIFLQNFLQTAENKLILIIQDSFGDSNTLRFIMHVPIILVRPHVTCFFMLTLQMCTDSLIAFKSAIMTCFGIYFITFFKLLYKDGRPFWINQDIKGFQCPFDFGGPGYHLYIITFFWAYNIFMYCIKYAEVVNKLLVRMLFLLLGLFSIWIIIAGLYTGTIYIYQNVIGMLYGFIYLTLCINFDEEIHRMCELTGFIVQSSRKYKFYLFFLCLILYVIILMYYNSELDLWIMPKLWVVNTITDDYACKIELVNTSSNRLGLDQTFCYASILFYIIGMGFGASYSLVHVDCIDWVHTGNVKKAVRTVIGLGISCGFYIGLLYINCTDNLTKIFMHYTLPALVISFFIYGLYPLLCLQLNLVHQDINEVIVQKGNISYSKPSAKKNISKIEENENEDDRTTTQDKQE